MFTGRPLERLFWFFVLVAVLGFVGFKVYGSHQQYSSNQFRTEIREVDADNFTFPEIVFCSWQLMDKFSLPCYKGIRLDIDFGSCPNNTIKFEAKIEDDDDHGPPEEGEIRDRNDWGKKVETTEAYFRPDTCVGINVSSMFTGKRKSNKVSKHLYLDIKGLPEYITDLKKSRFFVTTDEYTTNREISIGRHIFHVSHVKIINRLRAPFKSNCSNGEGDVNVFPEPYTRQKCKRTLKFKELLKYCSAVPDYWQQFVKPHHQKGWDFEGCNRTSENILWCFLRHMPKNDIDVPKKCPMPCRETVFEIDIETEKLYDQNRIDDHKRDPSDPRLSILPRFDVEFEDQRITEITEVPVYTMDDFFSDVGGWLGLLAGVSFLSLVEIVAFIFGSLTEKFC